MTNVVRLFSGRRPGRGALAMAAALAAMAAGMAVAAPQASAVAYQCGGFGGVWPTGIAFARGTADGWAVSMREDPFMCPDTGDGGVILATTDSGTRWVRQRVPLGVGSLEAVAAVSSARAWAAGDAVGFGFPGTAGVMLATTDGGKVWVKQKLPAGAGQVESVDFANSSDGWAAGVTTGGAAMMLSTTDGGAAWHEQTLPSGLSALAGVSFANATRGWAVGATAKNAGVVLSTADGGTRWTEQPLPSGIRFLTSVSFVNRSDGWAAGAAQSAGTLTGVIVATTNGGANWRREKLPTATQVLGGVSFANSADGWAAGLTGSGAPAMFATRDAGAAWAQQTLPKNAGSPYATVFAVGQSRAFLSTPQAITATSDGGTTWADAHVPSVTLGLSDLARPGSGPAWAVGARCSAWYTLGSAGCRWAGFRSSDGGKTWIHAVGGAGFFAGVSFPDASNGWITPEGAGTGALATADGGAVWTRQKLPAGFYPQDVSCVSASDCWAAGGSKASSLAMAATTNGGAAWTTQTAPASASAVLQRLEAITCLPAGSSADCWAAGMSGSFASNAVLKTADGGALWTVAATPSGTGGTLDAIACASTSRCWAAGYGKTSALILSTANGGASWSRETVPAGTRAILGVSFANGSDGWAVGAYTGKGAPPGGRAVILATTDGGAAWHAQAIPAGAAAATLLAVRFTTAKDGMAVGAGPNGQVTLVTGNGGLTWTAP